ncbi:MAG: 2Fe-2S iron-sulfur cluster-binding protein [Eubacteriales bacterium]|nr:2Fe-2S iron-sulfur cluster-binding protein [Eubacteriales bacterium]
MIVKIKRQADAGSAPYWQSFAYEGKPDATVAAVLDALNYTDDLFDIDGRSAPRIRWECSCMQKICGACGMLINGRPALACATFLRDCKGKELVLEPLSKFPVVADLIVDKSVIDESLRRAGVYQGEYAGAREAEYPQQYSVAKCLKCGLCLEVCPNYIRGENFFGAVFANDVYLAHSQSADRTRELSREYAEHFAKGCSKALSCQSVCPAGISTLTSILRLNSPRRK